MKTLRFGMIYESWKFRALLVLIVVAFLVAGAIAGDLRLIRIEGSTL
jgi:hypothetical protein